MEIDWLTYSPSLPVIMKYLDAAEVLRCKLVNKRLYGVVSVNSQTMPRRYAELFVTTDIPREGEDEHTRPKCLRIMLTTLKLGSTEQYTNNKSYTFYVTEHRIMMELPTTHRAIVDYYDKNEERLSEGTILPGETLFNLAQYRHYRVESMLEGARTLLSFIFRNYYFYEFYLHQDLPTALKTLRIPEDCLLMIHEEYNRTKSVIWSINHSYMWPEMNTYYSKFGVLNVIIHPYCTIDTLIPLITNWNYHFCIRFSPEEFESLQPFVALLKEWETGLVHLDSILFFSENRQPFLWTQQDLTDALSCFQTISTQGFEKTSQMQKDREHILITRALDDRKLMVAYSKEQEHMLVNIVKEKSS